MKRRPLEDRQLPLITPDSAWVAEEFFPSLRPYAAIGFDTETRDPGLNRELGSSWALGDGFILGFTVSTSSWSHYYPLRHPEDNLDADKCLAWLRHELAEHTGTIVGQNLAYDLGWAHRENIVAPRAQLYDTMFAAALLDEFRTSYSLDSLAVGYGLPKKDEALLRDAAASYGVDPKAGLWRLPARFVGPYAERDGTLPLEVRERQLPEIAAQGLGEALNLEHALLPLNVLMRKRGVLVDQDRVARTKKLLLEKETAALRLIKDLSGCNVEIWSAASLAAAFQVAGVPFETTALSQPSFQKEWLEEQAHPLPAAVRRARVYNKARRDFVEALVEDHLGADGRIHPELHPLRSEEGGTIGGRFSYSDPNMQQIPARDEEIGPLIRSLFVPEPGKRWTVLDVRQQEPRFTVHYAALLDLPGAADAVAAINAKPDLDYHTMVAELTGIPRKDAKIINLAKAYNMGGAKMCRKLGLPTEIWVKDNGDGTSSSIPVAGPEGKRIIRQYDERFPFIKKLNETCDRLAQERGWIKLFDGRRCRFPLYEPKGYKRAKPLPHDQALEQYGEVQRAYTHKAMNRLVQGSSAVMLKMALLKVWRETGVVPTLSVHDELDCELADDAEIRAVDECVRTAVKLRVPLLTDVEVGDSWGTVEKWQP